MIKDDSGVLVFQILGPLFLALGLYLLWYSRRRKKMLETFARRHHLRLRPELTAQLEKTLNDAFSLEGEGVVRDFGQLSSVMEGEAVYLFAAVELLDLNPHAQAYTTHFPRIAALFDAPDASEAFFLLDTSLRVTSRQPGTRMPDPDIVEAAKQGAATCQARHPLCVTVSHGRGLLYFEPLIVGGEKERDIAALHCAARTMRRRLSRHS